MQLGSFLAILSAMVFAMAQVFVKKGKSQREQLAQLL